MISPRKTPHFSARTIAAHQEAIHAVHRWGWDRDSENEEAVAQLRRRCSAVRNERRLLSEANFVIQKAAVVADAYWPTMNAIWEHWGRLPTADDVRPHTHLLAQIFPSWPFSALEAALETAAIYVALG